MPSYTAIIADPASARPAVECQETRWLARWKQRGQQPGGWPAWAVITGIAICMFGLRLAGPANLVSQDQERPAAYVLDVTKNGHWLCQRDLDGGITSKPPVWTWLSAVASLAWGRIGEFTLYLPGALAALGTAWLVYGAGKRFFGVRAGFMAAVAVLLTTAGYKQFGLARTDGVFTFTIAVSALLGFRAWQLRHGWIWFWMMSAVATLTKGPLGLILAAGGLLASGWEGAIHELKPVRGGHLSGIALFLLLTVGWLALSTWQLGSQVTDKLIREELLPQAIGKSDGHYPGTLLWQPCLYYLGRAAPWSVLTYFGLWQVWKSRKVPNNPWIPGSWGYLRRREHPVHAFRFLLVRLRAAAVLAGATSAGRPGLAAYSRRSFAGGPAGGRADPQGSCTSILLVVMSSNCGRQRRVCLLHPGLARPDRGSPA